MTRAGVLWGDARQRQSKVILSVATLNGFELDLPAFSFQNKPADFTDKFPYGKIPGFVATDGFKLSEGATIARYLSSIGTNADLLGSDPKEVAVIDQWVHFAEHEVGTPTGAISALIYGYGAPFTSEALHKYTEFLVRGLKHLETHLASRTTAYVASDALSLADLIVAGVINQACRLSLGINERKEYPAIFAHYEKVSGDVRIQQYWGTEGFVDAPITAQIKYS